MPLSMNLNANFPDPVNFKMHECSELILLIVWF